MEVGQKKKHTQVLLKVKEAGWSGSKRRQDEV
jgi:hypothetical protein